MPWKECSAVEERLRFVARLLDGESMTDLAREFGISRKTGYKIFDRYKQHGLEALADQSRRPVRYANQLPSQVEAAIVEAKRSKPHWGARKIRELLLRRLDGHVRVPAKSTIHAVLDRHGLVKRQGRKRNHATGTPSPKQPLPTTCGAPTSRASSSSATAAPAIPSPSPTKPLASSCSARPSNRPGKTSPSPPSSGSLPSVDCPKPSAPTTASPSPAPMPSST
jgi:transposase